MGNSNDKKERKKILLEANLILQIKICLRINKLPVKQRNTPNNNNCNFFPLSKLSKEKNKLLFSSLNLVDLLFKQTILKSNLNFLSIIITPHIYNDDYAKKSNLKCLFYDITQIFDLNNSKVENLFIKDEINENNSSSVNSSDSDSICDSPVLNQNIERKYHASSTTNKWHIKPLKFNKFRRKSSIALYKKISKKSNLTKKFVYSIINCSYCQRNFKNVLNIKMKSNSSLKSFKNSEIEKRISKISNEKIILNNESKSKKIITILDEINEESHNKFQLNKLKETSKDQDLLDINKKNDMKLNNLVSKRESNKRTISFTYKKNSFKRNFRISKINFQKKSLPKLILRNNNGDNIFKYKFHQKKKKSNHNKINFKERNYKNFDKKDFESKTKKIIKNEKRNNLKNKNYQNLKEKYKSNLYKLKIDDFTCDNIINKDPICENINQLRNSPLIKKKENLTNFLEIPEVKQRKSYEELKPKVNNTNFIINTDK